VRSALVAHELLGGGSVAGRRLHARITRHRRIFVATVATVVTVIALAATALIVTRLLVIIDHFILVVVVVNTPIVLIITLCRRFV
jgi:hypothetical protein